MVTAFRLLRRNERFKDRRTSARPRADTQGNGSEDIQIRMGSQRRSMGTHRTVFGPETVAASTDEAESHELDSDGSLPEGRAVAYPRSPSAAIAGLARRGTRFPNDCPPTERQLIDMMSIINARMPFISPNQASLYGNALMGYAKLLRNITVAELGSLLEECGRSSSPAALFLQSLFGPALGAGSPATNRRLLRGIDDSCDSIPDDSATDDEDWFMVEHNTCTVEDLAEQNEDGKQVDDWEMLENGLDNDDDDAGRLREMARILGMKTEELMALDLPKLNEFFEWLESSRIPGAQELLDALRERQRLLRESVELEWKIFEARKRRADAFGFIGKILFSMVYTPPTSSRP